MRRLLCWMLLVVGCVPTARSRPATELQTAAPPPPAAKSSPTQAFLPPTPAGPEREPTPDAGEHVIEGRHEWTGSEYRWVPPHVEKPRTELEWDATRTTH